jgi:hypothetical protein
MLDQLNTVIGFVSVMLLLSMTITVVVQAISALLDLRGQNLVWALANLFQQIHPDAAAAGKGINFFPPRTKTAAEELATAVLTHDAVTSTPAGGLYKAKAIRPDELLMVLQKLSQQVAKDPTVVSNAAKDTLNALLADSVPGTSANTDTLQKLSAELTRRFPMHSAMLQDAINNIAGRTMLITNGMERWFRTVMDRASDRFTRNCRFWTIAGAALLAFGFHVNSVELYRKIANDPNVKSKLVANAEGLQQQAEKAIGDLGSQALSDFANPKAEGQKDSTFTPSDQQIAALKNRPENLTNCAQAKQWITAQAALSSDEKLSTAFDTACTKAEKDKLARVSPELANIQKQLADSDLQVFGSLGWPDSDPKKLGGQFVTLLLLSLGAPFWFNALRQLSNLKPAISNKVADERAQAEQEAAKTPDKAKAAGA